MRTLLFLIAALIGWQYLLRPWFFRRKRDPVPEDPRFRGEDVQEADFEELKSKEDEKEPS